MKKIKVYLQYPWKFPDSSYYKNILDFPPEGIEFINYNKDSNKKINIIGSSNQFEKIRRFKNILRKILSIIKIPNITYTKNKNYDLIHCAHCLSLNNKPWVMDTETYDRIAATGKISYSQFGKWVIRKRLENLYCKKIICWSEECKKTFEEAFPGNQKILSKIEIIHFALKVPKINKIPHRGIRVLFVARWFDAKGGKQTLEVFDRLSKKYPGAKFLFICPTPLEFKKKYSKNKSIEILDLMPQEKLFNEIYPSCDIFFYPGFGDSYGFAVPEALAYGLPVITANSFAKKELVTDRITGFVINMPKNWTGYDCMDETMLSDFVKKTSLLLNDKKLIKKMGRRAMKEATEKFSIEKRNKKLEEVYRNALN